MADQLGIRKSERAREKQAKLDAEVRALVITDIMSTPSGRAYIWDKLTACHCFHQSFTPDPLTTAFNEGARSIGLAILADITEACPDHYITAMRESNDRSATLERRSSTLANRGDSGSIPDPGPGGPEASDGIGEDSGGTEAGPGDQFYRSDAEAPIGYLDNEAVRQRWDASRPRRTN